MKKMIFGTGLLLSGVVGFAGLWCLHGEDWIVLLAFAAMTIVGLVIAIRAIKEK